MKVARLEAFSDGVIAIIITIMVLELKVPHVAELSGLHGMHHVFLSYILSFIYVGIYWNNHHHLLHTVHRTNGAILWANLHLLFWLSLIPYFTAWMGETQFAPIPTACYGGVLLMAAFAYSVLSHTIIVDQGEQSILKLALGRDAKGMISLAAYLAAIPAALWVSPWVSIALFAALALLWAVPDRRIERVVDGHK